MSAGGGGAPMPEVTVGERGASGEAAGIEAAIAEGLRRAREAGRKDPTLRDAVWELLLEAGDTLGRLPNRERGWLTGASRAHWPAFARDRKSTRLNSSH